ncbi:hypothetical protein D9619_002333 [Psilocybe cf. subviscida]|uniref:Mur ligase central domain-containing protein n=1 Tax=Psilocybe cf. subviscida TaxID=2480587 RepID=A0A8H5EUA9_9AGAR|nr:hypothetical protein D9619_002333 [Psilocybe cf. subviscida]
MSIDLSLDRLKQLLPYLPYTRPTLHIAGTNGKGSVSALLTSILMASGPPIRVGRFNSPHLVSVLDSITINNVDVSEEIYNTVRQNVQDVDHEQGTKLTGFEILTLAALRIFETQDVDLVVLEVGLGGRLDATNIVPSSCILVSALTSVDLDHQAFLGDTVALIAREKAAIAREKKPFILGRQLHPEVESVAKEIVQHVGGAFRHASKISVPEQPLSEWSLLDDSASTGPPSNTVSFQLSAFDAPVEAQFPLQGAHQIDNLGTALGVINALLSFDYSESSLVHAIKIKERITPDSVVHGIANVKWRGRLSFHSFSISSLGSSSPTKLTVLADGAHNPASAKTLGAYVTSLLEQTSQESNVEITVPITYILSLSHSPPKTPLQTLSPILPPSSGSASAKLTLRTSVALLPFSPPEGMPWVKPVALDTMNETVRALLPDIGDENLWMAPQGEIEKLGSNGLKEALKWAAMRHGKDRGLVVIAGSLYLVADFYRVLNGAVGA